MTTGSAPPAAPPVRPGLSKLPLRSIQLINTTMSASTAQYKDRQFLAVIGDEVCYLNAEGHGFAYT